MLDVNAAAETIVGNTPLGFLRNVTVLTLTQRRRNELYRWKVTYFAAKLAAALTRIEK